MQRLLIILGLTFLLIGLLYPYVGKLPLGRLPGDIVVSKPNFRFYFPLTTMVLISLLLSLILWLIKK